MESIHIIGNRTQMYHLQMEHMLKDTIKQTSCTVFQTTIDLF